MVLEKLGIETATPGLQGIALIYYTTAASFNGNGQVKLIIVGNSILLKWVKKIIFQHVVCKFRKVFGSEIVFPCTNPLIW